MTTIELTGLDAQNPLAFLAALGLLRVLDDHARRRGHERPRLAFSDRGQQLPVLSCALGSYDDVASAVLADAAHRADCPVLQLAYDKDGNRVAASSPGALRDLKPPPGLARAVLDEAAGADRSSADLAAAVFSELVQQTTDEHKTKPTAFHFTAGQQAFLRMVDQLRVGISADDVREALLGPWQGLSALPSLGWDSSASRQWALRAENPSNEKRGSVPAANWLAVVGLSFFPVTVQHGHLVTSRVDGGWKNSVFSWPVWSPAILVSAASSLLRLDVRRFSARERGAMGVTQVFAARIVRSDYGSFAPADVVPPA
jgi:hypothetical protein